MRIYLLLMAIAAAVTYLVTPLARSLAQRSHALTPVRARDVHTVPTPRMGGVAMYVALAVTMLVASRIPFLDPVFAGSKVPWAIVGCAGLVCLLGVLDDILELDWMTKLVGQVLAAGLMAWQGVQLVTFPIAGLTITSSRISLVATVLVVVLIINAVNWVDGLDGLAAGLMAIGGGAFFLYSYLITQARTPTDYSNLATVVIAILVGMCVGFLPHNFYPARIFMGDSGSMLLGITFAAAGIMVTGQADPGVLGRQMAFPAFLPLLLPLAVVMLPLLDVTLTSIRRLVAGKSPFHADRTHLHHRLLDFGHSHRRAVVIMYVWATVIGFSAAAMARFPLSWVLPAAGVGIVIAAIATIRIPRRASRP